MNMQDRPGFSLIESLVVISIIGILTGMSTVAIPALRAHQELVADTESIRALLLDAKQRTLNQVRPEGCLPDLSSEDINRAGCSDVGVAIVGGEIIEFSNTNTAGTGLYKYNVTGTFGDHIIVKSKLASKLVSGSVQSLLFMGVPPSVKLYKDGLEFSSASDTALINLTSSNGTTRKIKVYSFGTIDVQ